MEIETRLGPASYVQQSKLRPKWRRIGFEVIHTNYEYDLGGFVMM